MSNAIVAALEAAAKRLGVAIGEDAARALTKLYDDVGHGAQAVAKHFAAVDKKTLESLNKVADDLGKTKLGALSAHGTGTPLRTQARSRIEAILNPSGSDGTLSKYIDDLRTQGHGVQRHLEVDNQGLKDRLGKPVMKDGKPVIKQDGHVKSHDFVDPETGLTTEVKADGSVKPHLCGPYATRFDRPKDMMLVDQHCRQQLEIHGSFPKEVPIKDVLGVDGHLRMTGFYRNPASPNSFLPVDFNGGTVQVVYRPDGAGGHKLHTIFPTPAPGRHP